MNLICFQIQTVLYIRILYCMNIHIYINENVRSLYLAGKNSLRWIISSILHTCTYIFDWNLPSGIKTSKRMTHMTQKWKWYLPIYFSHFMKINSVENHLKCVILCSLHGTHNNVQSAYNDPLTDAKKRFRLDDYCY